MIEHIVASGCSFTADGTGGLPPSLDHPVGSCSFIQDESYEVASPKTWIGHVAQHLQIKSLVNVSAGSHGNMLIANNIITLLNRYTYDPANTIILFNISDPARLDVPCSWDHPDKSTFCHWAPDIFPYSYLKRNSHFDKLIGKNMGIEQIELVSSNALLGMMSFLKQEKFNFKFLLMSDYTSHIHLGPVIKKFQSHMIDLNPGIGMKEFVENFNLNTDDKFHPDAQGHKLIANKVLEKLKE